MAKYLNPKTGLLVILILAAILRLWDLDQADVITDEGLNGFRSLGYIDFFISEYQTTPYDWLGADELPAWTKLSFHDHPPLGFLIQHVFLRLGGDNLWSLRLPFVLAGVGSVWLIYLIGKNLFTQRHPPDHNFSGLVGLLAAGLLAVNSYHVWVSRIGLQESLVIFFNLLTVYLFLKAFNSQEYQLNKYLLMTGVALGLAFLVKYTSLVLLPIFAIFILIYRRTWLKNRYFYLSGLVMLLFISPVIIYNLKLWQNFGHLDFQLSYLLGQTVEAWQFRLGRLQTGTWGEKLLDLLPAIGRGFTPVLTGLSALSVVALVVKKFYAARSHQEPKVEKYAAGRTFLLLLVFFHLLLFIAIGPRERFVAMIAPWLVLSVSCLPIRIYYWLQKNSTKSKILIGHAVLVLCLVMGYEIYFSVNTSLKPNKLSGQVGIDYSTLKHESLNWGYNELDKFLSRELYDGYYPAFQFATRFQFLEDIKSQTLDQAMAAGKKEKQVLLIYDQNMHSSATAWYIFRPFIYQGWPFISASAYQQALDREGQDFFKSQGVEEFYLIQATDHTLTRTAGDPKYSDAIDVLVSGLLNTEVISIKNSRVGEAFRVYKF